MELDLDHVSPFGRSTSVKPIARRDNWRKCEARTWKTASVNAIQNLDIACQIELRFFPALAATLVLVILHRVVAMLSLKWPLLAGLMKSATTVLVTDCKIHDNRLWRAELSRADLLEGLRVEQADEVESVTTAVAIGRYFARHVRATSAFAWF